MTSDQAIIEELLKYAAHWSSCPSSAMSGPCTCGFKELKDFIQKIIQEKTEKTKE